MALIEWREEYSVNVEIIDKQHKRLFEILNQFYNDIMEIRGQDSIKKVVNDLSEYAVIHFKTEEDIMLKIDYPDYKMHKKEHDTFVNKVVELHKKLQSGEFVLSIEVLNFLKDWLINHILKVDKNYVDFFNKNGIK